MSHTVTGRERSDSRMVGNGVVDHGDDFLSYGTKTNTSFGPRLTLTRKIPELQNLVRLRGKAEEIIDGAEGRGREGERPTQDVQRG